MKKIKAKGKNCPVSTMFYEEGEDGDDNAHEGVGAELGGSDMEEYRDMLEGDVEEGSEEEDKDNAADVSWNGESDEDLELTTMERLKDDLLADDDGDPKEGAYATPANTDWSLKLSRNEQAYRHTRSVWQPYERRFPHSKLRTWARRTGLSWAKPRRGHDLKIHCSKKTWSSNVS